jgi:plasmid stabilization system protein ParE
MKLILTVAALEDLRSIRAYTLEAWDEALEERYLDRLWTRFEILHKRTRSVTGFGQIFSPDAGSRRKAGT